ncbi:MAG: hypothetical protein R6U98_29820, partial [Pirellulaceae bacterium]
MIVAYGWGGQGQKHNFFIFLYGWLKPEQLLFQRNNPISGLFFARKDIRAQYTRGIQLSSYGPISSPRIIK